MLSTLRGALRSQLRSANVLKCVAGSCRNVARQQCFVRSFSVAAEKLQKGLTNELQYETENYEKPDILSKLPADWKLTDTAGDVNMKIEKDIDGSRTCRIEWQLISPFDPNMDDMGEEGAEEQPEPTDEVDFQITIEQKDGSKGMAFYCTTQSPWEGQDAPEGEKDEVPQRFVVGNVKVWDSLAERDNASAYNGPDFTDLEDSVQEALDEYLGELGIDSGVFDFIDASAVDKEHREYMRWLEKLKGLVRA